MSDIDEVERFVEEATMDPLGWARANIAGTFATNWRFLRYASASSFSHAARETSRLLELWKQGLDSGDSPAKLSFEVSHRYSLLASGPLLSVVLTPFAATEAFISYCASSWWFRLGVDPWKTLWKWFDGQSFNGRLKSLLVTIGAEELEAEPAEKLEQLRVFRNSVTHDKSMLQGPRGELIYVSRKGKLAQPSQAGEAVFYPLVLHGSSYPLSIRHGLEACLTHDALVDHVLGTGSTEFQECFGQLLSPESRGDYRITDIEVPLADGGSIWARARDLTAFWEEEFLPWEKNISFEEHEDLLRDLLRRRRLRVEGDDETESE